MAAGVFLLSLVLLLSSAYVSAQPTLLSMAPTQAGEHSRSATAWEVYYNELSTFLLVNSVAFTPGSYIDLTLKSDTCDRDFIGDRVNLTNINGYTATATFKIDYEGGDLHICLNSFPQGSQFALAAINHVEASESTLFPIGVSIILVFLCLALSALFSGLTLGLMGLDPTELRVLMESGTEREKKYARKILPVRELGNYVLCTIVLGNVFVINTCTIILESISSGLVAIMISTAGIVLFGEIIPLALCARYGLRIASHSLWIMRFFMVLTFPLSYPISKLLDYFLGAEAGVVYQRKQLLQLVMITNKETDLAGEEVGFLKGALTFRDKTVATVMTKLHRVFMVEEKEKLNFNLFSQIMETGHSRIPVYRENRANIVGLILVKDLAFMEQSDTLTVEAVMRLFNHPIHSVSFDTTLDKIFGVFKKGASHIAYVVGPLEEGGVQTTLGIVTMEDVLEEILQEEILDEKDVEDPNQSLFPHAVSRQDVHISDKLARVAFNFLSTEVEPFMDVSGISKKALSELIMQKHTVVQVFKEGSSNLYTMNHSTSLFTLVLEGYVKVVVGKDNLSFEAGPFTVFGVEALKQHTPFIPDYTVTLTSPTVVLLQVSLPAYLDALKLSQNEHLGASPDIVPAARFSPRLRPKGISKLDPTSNTMIPLNEFRASDETSEDSRLLIAELSSSNGNPFQYGDNHLVDFHS